MKTGRARRQRGASVLLLSIVFLIILFLLASVLYQIVPAEFHMASRTQQDIQGHYVARAGLEETMTWLGRQMEKFTVDQQETNLPDYTTSTDPSDTNPPLPLIEAAVAAIESRSPVDNPDWQVDIEVVPYQTSLGLKHALEPRFYSISATSLFQGRPVKRLDVLVRQRTFASFAYMTNHTDPRTPMDITDKPTFHGPVHTNENFFFRPRGGFWDTARGSERAFFQDAVSHAGFASGTVDGNVWQLNSGDTTSSASNSPETNSNGIGYDQVFAAGRSGLRKKNAIALPENSSDVRNEAWKSADAIPSELGVHISTDSAGKANGGLFVQGNIAELVMALDKSGNQHMVFETDQVRDRETTQVWDPNRMVRGPVTGQRWNPNAGTCLEREPLPAGNAGGVSGGGVTTPCVRYEGRWETTYGPDVNQPGYVNVYNDVYTDRRFEVFEITEAPVQYVDENGQSQTAAVGDTLILNYKRTNEDNSWTAWGVESSQVVDGQINGTVYVNGNIGVHNTGTDNDKRGIWGITKGSAKMDGDTLPPPDEREYVNKTIATPLDKSINIGGDLLQFDHDRFYANTPGTNYVGTNSVRAWDTRSSDRNRQLIWENVALKPDPVVNGEAQPPEKSPNNHHVLGLFTRDVWMKGFKNRNDPARVGGRAGRNGVNDVYAVILAGKLQSNDTAIGGFGTWHADRDNVNDYLGTYRLVGGVIQGTTGSNSNNSSETHAFHNEGVVGYSVEMHYDIEATRQRLFPTVPEFTVVRYLERSARERS